MTLSQTQESDEEGYFLLILPSSRLGMLRSPSELVPPLFRPKLHPCIKVKGPRAEPATS